MRHSKFLPEGKAALFPRGQPIAALYDAMENRDILTGIAMRCDKHRDLHVRFGGYEGLIPHSEAVHHSISGADRDISILSLVGRRISFTITAAQADSAGRPQFQLSRAAAQEQAIEWLFENAEIGSVLPASVTHLAPFGAFVDIGCGFISMVPLENLSFSRAEHPAQRLYCGQNLFVLVTDIDRERHRFYLSHKELLGTWLQNAADFSPGDTVPGIVRGIKEYGAFVELTPNLSGLANRRPDLSTGDFVSVLIRSVHTDSRKIKLQIIRKSDSPLPVAEPRYFITDGLVRDWVY